MNKNILLNINAKKVRYLNCYDNNIIADISRFYNCNYLISLLGEFDFTYRFIDCVENLLDYNNIFTGDILYVPYMLSELVGISLKHIEVKKKDEYTSFIKYITQFLERKMPVGIGVDSYYLPWNQQYRKLHRRHYLLISGINFQENIFYCIDSYLSHDIEKIPISALYNKYDRLVLIDHIEQNKNYSLNSVIEKLVLCLSKSGKSSNCNTIRNFAQDITNQRFLVDEKIKGTVLGNSNFLFRLTDIVNCRYNFLQALNYMKDKFELYNMDSILSETYNVFKDWGFVKNIIMKGYISGKVTDSLKRASEALLKIADSEEVLLRQLILLSKT